MKPRAPEPKFYTLPALAHAWGCDVEQIELLAMFDGLQTGSVPMTDGREIPVVTREEKARFEGHKPERRYNPTERETHLLLIGALAVAYCGGDPAMIEEPGRLVSDLEKCAEANGAPVPRSYDANRAAIAEAIELLQLNGYKSNVPGMPRINRKRKPAQSEARAEVRTG